MVRDVHYLYVIMDSKPIFFGDDLMMPGRRFFHIDHLDGRWGNVITLVQMDPFTS